jgi:hypothetical protein
MICTGVDDERVLVDSDRGVLAGERDTMRKRRKR